MKYILASASPRRRELLSLVIQSFEVSPATAEEKVNISMFPEQTAVALAESKCDEVYENHRDSTVIACDTVVSFEGEILGKPKDADDAYRTLKRLSGKTHYVVTGVCVRNKNKRITGFDGIQDGGIVNEYFGSYTNVVGLPVKLVKKMLEEVC